MHAPAPRDPKMMPYNPLGTDGDATAWRAEPKVSSFVRFVDNGVDLLLCSSRAPTTLGAIGSAPITYSQPRSAAPHHRSGRPQRSVTDIHRRTGRPHARPTGRFFQPGTRESQRKIESDWISHLF